MTSRTSSFADIEHTFVEYIKDIMYATMITVDPKGRPRARVMLPIWEVVNGRPVGWLAAYKTPVKAAHLANNPHTTFSYWNPRQNAVHIDGISSWAEDGDAKRHAWDLYRAGSPPGVGYDPASFWRGGPNDPEYHVIRTDPWRVQLLRGADLRSTLWVATDGPACKRTP